MTSHKAAGWSIYDDVTSIDRTTIAFENNTVDNWNLWYYKRR